MVRGSCIYMLFFIYLLNELNSYLKFNYFFIKKCEWRNIVKEKVIEFVKGVIMLLVRENV